MPFSEAGKYTVLQEYYDPERDGAYGFGEIYYEAQTIVPEFDFHLTQVSLKLRDLWRIGNCELAIQKTGFGGVPDGTDIAVAILDRWYINPFFYKWNRFLFMDYPLLEAGTRYAMVARAPEAHDPLIPSLAAKRWYGRYPGGVAYKSEDAGENWEMRVLEDWLFRVWGFPPPGVIPPIPEITNFAIEYTQYIYTETGYIIFVVTDRPCHLFMLWTNVDPRKHIDPVFERGLFIHSNPRFCFVAYEENEQEEPGDTLSHTFLKPDWRVCETRHFIFTGSRQDKIQPSMSNLFKLHRGPHSEVVFLGRESNRSLAKAGVNWDICRNATHGDIVPNYDPPESLIVAGSYLSARYWNYAGYLEYYTQQIEPQSQILGAYLDIFVYLTEMESSEAYPYLYVMEGDQHDPVERGDYGTRLAFDRYYGRIRYDELIPGQYNRIHFNSYGVSQIKAGEITKLCLRSQLDVEDEPPALGANWCMFHSTQKGDEFQPLLGVFWKPPPIPNFIEYWSYELDSNHPWEKKGFICGSRVNMRRGTMTVINDGQHNIHVDTTTSPINPSLLGPNGKNLRVFYSSPSVEYDETGGWLSYHIVTTNGIDQFLIEPVIARGSLWGDFGSVDNQWEDNYAFDLGQGPGSFDFTSRWIRGRQMAELSDDPTGWYVMLVRITTEQFGTTSQEYHTNDYIGFTYEK